MIKETYIRSYKDSIMGTTYIFIVKVHLLDTGTLVMEESGGKKNNLTVIDEAFFSRMTVL